MTVVESLERTIEQLPAAELAKFRSWFVRFDEAAWDAQIEADGKAGKLDSLAAEALKDYSEGKAQEL